MTNRKYFLEGKKIHNFTVGSLVNGLWRCVCCCGTIRWITGRDINSGKYKSCGCKSNPNREEYYDEFKKKFWERTKKLENGCVEWTGNKRNGYGRVGYKRKLLSCTHVVWEWEKGNIPKGLIICHKCDNPSCVNVEHLFLGDQYLNVKDCVKKGRLNSRKGSKNINAKLNEEKVLEIKKRYEDGESCLEISNRFLVSTETIYRILRGTTWKHVLG